MMKVVPINKMKISLLLRLVFAAIISMVCLCASPINAGLIWKGMDLSKVSSVQFSDHLKSVIPVAAATAASEPTGRNHLELETVFNMYVVTHRDIFFSKFCTRIGTSTSRTYAIQLKKIFMEEFQTFLQQSLPSNAPGGWSWEVGIFYKFVCIRCSPVLNN